MKRKWISIVTLVVIMAGALPLPASAATEAPRSGHDVTVGPGMQFLYGWYQYTGTLTIQGYVQSGGYTNNGNHVTIVADRIVIESGARLDAKWGYYSNSGPGRGGRRSRWSYGMQCFPPGGGAGHGNWGGGPYSGQPYGSSEFPTTRGSGGNSQDSWCRSSFYGGRGGGAIRLIGRESITIDGSITANGGHGYNTYQSGGGSGGSIWMDAPILRGSGALSANGGNGGQGTIRAGGGAGGRIAIYCDVNAASLSVSVRMGASVAPPRWGNGYGTFHNACTGSGDVDPPVVTNVDSVAGTGDGSLAEGETTDAEISQLLVTFSEAVKNSGASGVDSVTNPANYALSGVGGGAIAVDSVAYDSGTKTATLDIHGGTPLPADTYSLTVVGSSSIEDLFGNKLDGNGDGIGGDDFVLNFVVDFAPPDSTAPDPPIISSPAEGLITNDSTPTVSGSAEADSTVEVFDDAESIGTTSADGSGNWSFTSGALSDGSHSFTATATDAAGNTSDPSAEVTISIDTVPPTVTINKAAGQDDPTNSSPILFTALFSEEVVGFASGDVTVSGSAAPTLATVGGTSPSYQVSVSGMANDGSVEVSIAAGVAQDAAGNANLASTSTDNDVTYDTTPPTVFFGDPSPLPNGHGWNNTNVTIPFSASDNMTGVADLSHGSPLVLSTEGASVSVEVTATDGAGNSAIYASPAVSIDKSGPSILAAQNPPANANGWNNSLVTVSYAAADPLSGLDTAASSLSDDILDSEGAGQSASGLAADLAGNVSIALVSDINIDMTDPNLSFGTSSPLPNAYGWNNTNVSVAFFASDALSGIDFTDPASSPLLLSAEGAAVTGQVTVTDLAGNSASFTSPAVWIDKTPPAIEVLRDPAANANGWNNSDVSVSFSASDGLSGVDLAASSLDEVVLSAEGAGQSASGMAVDFAGNLSSASAEGINIDKTDPNLTFGTPAPAPNANGWNNTDVEIPFLAGDALSGIDFTNPVSSPLVLSLEGSGVAGSVSVTDMAGNSRSFASPSANIDKTAPSTTIMAAVDSHGDPVSDGGETVSRKITFTFAAFEAVSGVEDYFCSLDGEPFAACDSPAMYPGLAQGGHTFQVYATDLAGNQEASPRSFGWTIISPSQAAGQLQESLQTLLEDPDTPAQAQGSLQKAGKSLGEAIERLAQGKDKQALDELRKVIHELEKAAGKGADVSGVLPQVVDLARLIALNALDDALQYAGASGKVDREIAKAELAMEEGEQLFGAGQYEHALNRFEQALNHAQKAIEFGGG